MVKGKRYQILVVIQLWQRFVHTLSSIIVVACSDRGAGNDSEALGSVYSPVEALKQSMILTWQIFALSEYLVYFSYLSRSHNAQT